MLEVPPIQRKLKVYAYVTRHHPPHTQVLVFGHMDFPEAGTQVPGGSVEEGERDLPEEWVHIVSAGVQDTGMRFRYFWMELREAATLLAGEQGRLLLALFE